MIDKVKIAGTNWAEDYLTKNGRRFNSMLRDAFITGFNKGVALSRTTGHIEIKVISPFDGEDCYCSNCGAYSLLPTYKFCPMCGCKFTDVRQEGEEQ